VLGLLRDSCRSADATLVMATHSNEAVVLADRVLGIDHSVIAERPK
jgi:ABC-type lipoprotein export system ATPase subunit